MNLRANQKVVCVDDSPRSFWRQAQRPVLNRVYTTSSDPFMHKKGFLVIEIVELANPFGGYLVERFRPAVDRKTDISIFTEMLNPSPEKVRDHIMFDALADVYRAADKIHEGEIK